jgi:hypothetical protein
MLPEQFRRFFWDVDFDDLNFDKYPRFIAERLLNYGDPDSIKWLYSTTGISYIRSVIEQSRNLNAKARNYWQIMLDDRSL